MLENPNKGPEDRVVGQNASKPAKQVKLKKFSEDLEEEKEGDKFTQAQ